MRLTTFSDYSLRVLMYTALIDDRLVTIGEIAKAHDISHSHLMKVVHHLAQKGYLETIRGKGGGFRLSRSPAEIIVGVVVREAEMDSVPVECFDPKNSNCRILPACRLRHCIAEAENQFYKVLERYSLADLVGNKKRLIQCLSGTQGA